VARGDNALSAVRRFHPGQDDIQLRDPGRFRLRAGSQISGGKNDPETLEPAIRSLGRALSITARIIYLRRLEIKPEDALMNRRERRAASKNSGTVRKASTPGTSAALCEAGLHHFRAGRHLDAQLCCQQALELNPDHADTLHLMGLLSLRAGQYDHAVEWISRAIRQDPRSNYLASLGATLQQQGRYEEALKVFDKAIQLSPDDAELWRQIGDILLQQERYDQALLGYQHALKLNPDHPDALYKSGVILDRFGRYEEALAHLDRGDKALPNRALTLQARARTLFNLKRLEESWAEAKRVYRLDPDNADTCNNIGAALRLLGRHKEALKWFDKALDIKPNSLEIINNKIILLYHLHRFDEIFALYARVKSLKLNDATIDGVVSLAYLLTGNFEAGWPLHQARLKLPAATYPKINLPMWLGDEDIQGKTILVAAEEGLGDTIQFVRYVPMLAERGARILLVVQDALYGLLSGLSDLSQCIPKSAATALSGFEFHCPVSSLPLAFGTRLDTIPSTTSYLPSLANSRVQAWEDRLGPRTRLRVGLVWSGNPVHMNDHNRSTSLRTLSRILDVDATFVSLQKDPRPNDAAVLREQSDIIDLTADLTDFTETAALVSCLDLVITVDTSVAHLSGALGRPTWLLLPYTPDYRWLLDRDDSPWYPSMRLFRQTETREYESVLDRVRTELVKLISVRKPADQPG
jgi:tetratricopeptide (TPR) repeat protein